MYANKSISLLEFSDEDYIELIALMENFAEYQVDECKNLGVIYHHARSLLKDIQAECGFFIDAVKNNSLSEEDKRQQLYKLQGIVVNMFSENEKLSIKSLSSIQEVLLNYACKINNQKVISLLIRDGSDLNIDNKYKSHLVKAISEDHDLIKLIRIQFEFEKNSLLEFANSGNINSFEKRNKVNDICEKANDLYKITLERQSVIGNAEALITIKQITEALASTRAVISDTKESNNVEAFERYSNSINNLKVKDSFFNRLTECMTALLQTLSPFHHKKDSIKSVTTFYNSNKELTSKMKEFNLTALSPES